MNAILERIIEIMEVEEALTELVKEGSVGHEEAEEFRIAFYHVIDGELVEVKL